MKKLMVVAGMACMFALLPATYASHGKATCKTEAGDKKGAERKAFMKSCMAQKRTEHKATRSAQQEKMKACNADAKKDALTGDKRRAFMKECLSKKAA
jgi:psiF repeat